MLSINKLEQEVAVHGFAGDCEFTAVRNICGTKLGEKLTVDWTLTIEYVDIEPDDGCGGDREVTKTRITTVTDKQMSAILALWVGGLDDMNGTDECVQHLYDIVGDVFTNLPLAARLIP